MGDVDATDGDGGSTDENVDYAITGGNSDVDNDSDPAFSIESRDGELLVNDGDDLDHEAKESFSLTVEADDGANTESATVTVNVGDVAPTISDQTIGPVPEDASQGTQVGTVSSGGDPSSISFSILSNKNPDGDGTGAFNINSSTGVVTVNDEGDLDYETNSSLNITVEVTDAANSSSATVTVDVSDVNEAPVASADDATTDEDTDVVVDVLANDEDPDGSLDPSTVTVVSSPSHGTIDNVNPSNGKITYSPNQDYNGSDSFTYTVDDEQGATSNQASVDVTINAVPDIALTDGRNDSNGGTDYDEPAPQPGTDNNPVGRFKLSADESGSSLASVTISNNATSTQDVTALELWTSGDATFDGSGGDTQVASKSNQAQGAFSNLGISIPTGGLYVFVVVDLGSNASGDHDPLIASQSDISFSGGTLSTVNGAATSTFTDAFLSSASTALPVELARFEARMDGNTVRVRWKTVSETGNAAFRVQRKNEERASSAAWETIGSVPGAGTTSEPQTYTFADRTPRYEADSLFYRLKQVDSDGTVHFSESVVVERRDVSQLQLFGPVPNPVHNEAAVRLAVPENSSIRDITLQIYDLLGRAVRTHHYEAAGGRVKVALDVNELPSGVYVLRLQAGDAIETRQMTVVH